MLFVALLAKEVLAGAMLGVVCQFVFYGIQMAGVLIDSQRGMTQLSYMAPQLPGPASVLGQLKLQVAIVVFLISNGHLLYIRALDSSFRSLGVLQFPHIAPGSTALLETAARLSANALLIGLQMAAPVLVALLMVDVAFGLIGRMAQGIQVHQESQPVKAMAGLGILLLASGFWMTRLEAHLGAMLGSVNQMVQVSEADARRKDRTADLQTHPRRAEEGAGIPQPGHHAGGPVPGGGGHSRGRRRVVHRSTAEAARRVPQPRAAAPADGARAAAAARGGRVHAISADHDADGCSRRAWSRRGRSSFR